MVHNEVGVVLYRQKQFEQAKDQFANALSLCNETNSRTYETILINLAHCHRKIKDLDSAVMLYEKCLTINPKNASTYTSLGFAHHLKGEFRTALNCYHKAHFLKHELPNPWPFTKSRQEGVGVNALSYCFVLKLSRIRTILSLYSLP